jgi:hypothetical protein
MPQASAALGSAGSIVSDGYNAGANIGMYLSVVGTTFAQDALVFKISSLSPV